MCQCVPKTLYASLTQPKYIIWDWSSGLSQSTARWWILIYSRNRWTITAVCGLVSSQINMNGAPMKGTTYSWWMSSTYLFAFKVFMFSVCNFQCGSQTYASPHHQIAASERVVGKIVSRGNSLMDLFTPADSPSGTYQLRVRYSTVQFISGNLMHNDEKRSIGRSISSHSKWPFVWLYETRFVAERSFGTDLAELANGEISSFTEVVVRKP